MAPTARRAVLLLRGLGQCGLGRQGGCGALWGQRWISAQASPAPPRPSAPRTATTSPAQHTTDHRGLWYTLEQDMVTRLFTQGGMTKSFVTQCRTLAETCLMVRQPALTMMDYVRRTSPSDGPDGCGKTLALAHATHFLAESGWLLVHVPWAPNWRRRFKEVAPSTTVEGQYNHPLDAAVWLQHFKTQNAELLKTLQLETQKEYTWSRREVTEVNSPLMELVETGIGRARYSSDCVLALTSELKAHAAEGRCKVAVVVDGINTFFAPVSRYRGEDRSFVDPQHFTLFHAFKQLFTTDWKNGVLVGSLDRLANESSKRGSHLPRYLLRQKGWEALDPFVPIPVDDYDDLEFRSAIDYYLERRWLQNPMANTDMGRRELAALSAHNPFNLVQVCRPL
ncbi:28S ribosomal protein S29, mitochondrial [Chionoecetes opilio]|uniref:Small ribosomal subunit protein mS29 n=1 Tax=Chionoecetes opilio TaxID=41210 RepID=A0A8J4YGB7_CHIOP|nr:28S ribosomal protein S29, mitochondrial [Chionoecetes opilio]